jgi:hypothetical protein
MKTHGGSGCIDPCFLDLGTAWRWVVSFTLRPLYSRGKSPGTHRIGGWVDPRAGLDDMEMWKFLPPPGLELRPLGRPARIQSLYRLRYPGTTLNRNKMENCFLITYKWFPQNKHPNTGCKPSVYKHDVMNSFLDNICVGSDTLRNFRVKSISFLCTTELQFGLSDSVQRVTNSDIK